MARDRTTLTILFTDVVGSTELGAERGDEHAQAILGRSAALASEAVGDNGGSVVKSLGDGLLCTFRGPRAAIAAAIAVQGAHAQWQAEDGADSVPVRIGIHTGEVDESDEDVHGEAVNAAARICAAADRGQILISSTARGAAGSGAGLNFSKPQQFDLKGFPAPFELSAVNWRHSTPDRSSGPVPLEQRIHFCEIDGHRIAWSQVGSGPALVVPSPWVSNLQADWEDPGYRSFIEQLARDNTVIRYDRPGTGLSDRHLPDDPSLDGDVRILEGLIEQLKLAPVSLFGVSCGGCIAAGYAARNPDAVSATVFTGCYPDGNQLASEEVRDSLVSVIRASWGLGSRMLSDIFVADGSPAEREAWASAQRASADPDTAAELYRLIYDYDVSGALEHVSAPALVIHRNGDTAVKAGLGRELAASLPNARFVPLDGSRHLPWQGDSEPIVAETLNFLAQHAPSAHGGPAPDIKATTASSPRAEPRDAGPGGRGLTGPINPPGMTPREIEILRLVADGLSDREIAERLVLSPHTVHRHVANIRSKLGQPSRAAAAAYAARLELI